MTEERLDLLGQIAVWYYEDNLDQAEISDRIGRSRSMVSRMLQEVRELGLVEFRINFPLRRNRKMEDQLCINFGLDQAWVLEHTQYYDNTSLLRILGKLGARCLQSRLFDGVHIGVGWGGAVLEVVRAMPQLELQQAVVVQLIGSVSHESLATDGSEITRRLSEKLNASYRFLPAPLFVNSRETAQNLLQQKAIRETLDLAKSVDVALIGIGTTDPELSSLMRAGYMTNEELKEIQSGGAVGDVLSTLLSEDGVPLELLPNHQSIGLDSESLRSIPSVIGVAGNAGKAPAILAALRGQYVNVLVTDVETATEVINLHHQRFRKMMPTGVDINPTTGTEREES
jgi:deoxyribonucleoside regulator